MMTNKSLWQYNKLNDIQIVMEEIVWQKKSVIVEGGKKVSIVKLTLVCSWKRVMMALQCVKS